MSKKRGTNQNYGNAVPQKVNFKPKTEGQVKYVKEMLSNTVTFCTGPAGTGKSMCAIAVACRAYLNGDVANIVIARPAVEASERGLGFLPGDLKEKIMPYLAPAIAHMKKLLGRDLYAEAVEAGEIRFETLEYMRGMTFDNAFMILEEAQNCTTEQLIMFITRIGDGSKIVISGDTDQTDLINNLKITDLEHVIERVKCKALVGFASVQMTEDDIVRNPIIKDFLKAMQRL